MKNKNQYILFIILGLSFLAFVFFYILKTEQKIKIAVCPTLYEIANSLDGKKYKIIKTNSTSESLDLIKNSKADMVLSGRKLKLDEPVMESILLKEGYSFLAKNELVFFVDQLKNYNIYTNLEKGVLENFAMQNISYVDDVYQYIDEGIAITTWENTDYTKAEIVHIFENNGERYKLSRQPTIYCSQNCGKDAQDIALLIKQI
jgi:hypothetical protein